MTPEGMIKGRLIDRLFVKELLIEAAERSYHASGLP